MLTIYVQPKFQDLKTVHQINVQLSLSKRRTSSVVSNYITFYSEWRSWWRTAGTRFTWRTAVESLQRLLGATFRSPLIVVIVRMQKTINHLTNSGMFTIEWISVHGEKKNVENTLVYLTRTKIVKLT